MNILLIIDAIPLSSLGGASRITWDIGRGLVAEGHTVTVLTTYADMIPQEKDGIRILTIPERAKPWAHYRSVFSGKRAREIMEHIDAVKPDIIHAHVISWQCGYRWIPLARKKKIPVIVTCHDVTNIAYARILADTKSIWLRDALSFRWYWNPFRTTIIRSLFNRFCTVLTVSDALRAAMEKMGFTNLRTVHNGINLSFWKTDGTKQEARTKLGLPQEKTLFLFAGRLGPDKGTVPVSQALPADAHLVIAGSFEGNIFDHLGDRLHQFDKQSAEQMRLLYTACDVTLVPSLCLDCFPTVCLESMAVSRPVIATHLGGSKEAVINGKTGWILDPRDLSAFQSRMQWCMDHPDDCEAMGQEGRKRMEETFSQEIFLRELMEIYKTQKGTL